MDDPRRQHLIGLLHESGPRVFAEFIAEAERDHEIDLTDKLERYCRIPPSVYRTLGADLFPERMLEVPECLREVS